MSSPIEDYGLIGDGQTTALVNRDGSVDWLCWPRFDSDACLAALLGDDRHGYWSFSPRARVTGRSRRYEKDTLVLQTDAEAEGGAYRITDFMPIRRGDLSALVRIVEGLSGTVALDMVLKLRFAYGTMPPWCEATERGITARIGPDQVSLDAPVPVKLDDDVATSAFIVREGERLCFVLSYSSRMDTAASDMAPLARNAHVDAETALLDTRKHWHDWIGRFDIAKTRWPDVVKRSLITLKAMVHHLTGGLVAAPTTSLPEIAGGEMNWDYRYCWLRDASFTLGAFLNAGFTEEATAWRDWLLRAVGGAPDRMQIMYRLDGGRHLDEYEMQELPGYRDAKPVLIGNAAAKQHQIDVYGEVLDCLDLARRAGIEITPHHVAVERRIVDHLEKVWNTPGSGVWESRGHPRQYTYSKVMAWAGFDRAVRAGGSFEDETPECLAHLRALRDKVHTAVEREGWNEGLGAYTQAYGNEAIDASLLLMPLVGFLPADEPRMTATIAKVQEVLSEGGLIRRLKAKVDGPNEGAFLPCSCWMADCLNLQGRHEEAVAQFERLLAVGNDLGLFAEEYNVPAQHMTGNFPQALTHLAIVNTALSLSGPVLTRGA